MSKSTYTISFPDGTEVDIRADNPIAAKADASVWYQQQGHALSGATGQGGQVAGKPDNSFLGQGARGVVSSVGDLAEKAGDTAAPGFGSWAGDAMALAGQGRNPLEAGIPNPAHGVANAQNAQLVNALLRSVAAHTGTKPAQLPQALTNALGPTSGQQQSQVPWLRDQPTTLGGRASRTAGAALPYAPFAAIAPGATAQSVIANTAAPAAGAFGGSEIARALGGSQDDQQLASVAGGVTGGALVSALMGGPSGGTKAMANRTPRMTPEQMADVIDRMRTGERIGLQPTTNEAIDAAVPGARTTMLQQAVEGTPEGTQVLGPRMAQRPDQMQAVMADVLSRISPDTPDAAQTALNVQGGAEGALNNARQGVNAAARPHYDALPGQELPPAEFAALQQDPSFGKALAAFRANPELSKPYANLPDNNLAVVNEVVKTLQDMRDNVTPNPANPQGSRQLMSVRGNAVGSANAAASSASPDYANARQIVAQGHQDVIDPMSAGPIGALARPERPELGSQIAALFPEKPFPDQPQATADALNAIRGDATNPGAALMRAMLERQTAESAQRIAGKPNTFAPSNLSTKVAGNPLQRETLMSGVNAVAPDAVNPLADALNTFDTTGMRQGEGSNTVSKSAAAQEANAGGKVITAVMGERSKGFILEGIRNWANAIGVEINQRELTRIVDANPERAAAILQQIEASRGNTAGQRAALGALRGAAVGNATAPK